MASKTVIEKHELYGGRIILDYYPNKHMYKVEGDTKIGVTGVTGIINKESLMVWPMDEAVAYLKRELITGNDPSQTKLWTNGEFEDKLDKSKLQYKQKQTRGTDIGTVAHDWLEHFLLAKQNNTPIPEKLQKINIKEKWGDKPNEFDDDYIRDIDHNGAIDAVDQFIDWFNGNDVEVIDVEKIIYSIEYDYCGRFDAILKINGKIVLIDFKTTNPSFEFPKGIYPENFAQLGGYDVAYTEEHPEFTFDAHAVFNISKKTGKLNIEYSDDVEENRKFFLFTLGTKRSMQHYTRRLSAKYNENKRQPKKN